MANYPLSFYTMVFVSELIPGTLELHFAQVEFYFGRLALSFPAVELFRGKKQSAG